MTTSNTQAYVGRFAPSPSGPLHLGSLVCALASYLDAKSHHGTWLVRIEDIDPPREQAGADRLILETLKAHGLHWDGDVSYQSQHHVHFRSALANLERQAQIYRCDCPRKRINQLNGIYDGRCRSRKLDDTHPSALRFNTESTHTVEFEDEIQGLVRENFEQTGDFVIHRKDGLFAYQLAVSCDDLRQHISHVVRGADLLDTTAKQIFVITALGGTQPSYSHIPVITDSEGRKLSKQNRAPAIANTRALTNLQHAFKALQIPFKKYCENIDEQLEWAVEHWQPSKLKGQKTIQLNDIQ